jgi:dTDP-glucose pyrophosphorylase
MEKTIVILAAGIGSRYGGLKQMDPVGPSGEFIIDYSVFDAIRAGFNKVIFIIRHDISDDFENTIGNRIKENIKVAYTFQELDDLPDGIEYPPDRKKPWGTVQAALTCDGMVNSPFAVINADDFYGRESYITLSNYLDSMYQDKVNACMVGYRLEHTLSKYGSVTRGICQRLDTDMLDSVVETSGIYHEGDGVFYEDDNGKKTELNPNELVSMNFWGFTPSILELLREEFKLFLQAHAMESKSEFVIPTAVNQLIKKDKASVKVLSTESSWFGITNPEDKKDVIAQIQQLVQSGEYPDNLWKVSPQQFSTSSLNI